jgi:hypothetical protein
MVYPGWNLLKSWAVAIIKLDSASLKSKQKVLKKVQLAPMALLEKTLFLCTKRPKTKRATTEEPNRLGRIVFGRCVGVPKGHVSNKKLVMFS